MATQVIQYDALMGDIRALTIRTAYDALRAAGATNSDTEQTWRTIVDGRFNAPIESVKPYGRIELVRRDLGEVIEWVWSELRRRSPVLTGKYQDSHLLLINGVQAEDISAYKPGDKVQFANIQPYARKIEGGHGAVPSFHPQSAKAPNGVYRAVFAAAKRKFGKAAFIDFRWQQLSTGYKVMHRAGGRSKGVRHNRERRKVLGNMIYPVISIRMLGEHDA